MMSKVRLVDRLDATGKISRPLIGCLSYLIGTARISPRLPYTDVFIDI